MTMDDETYVEREIAMVNAVKSKEDLIELLHYLSAGYRNGHEEEQPMREYLSGYSSLALAMDSWFMNLNKFFTERNLKVPDEPDWNVMGRLAAAAFSSS